MQADIELSPFRRGFMKRLSFTTNLLVLASFDVKGFNLQTDVIYTGLIKAFDLV